MRTVINIHSGGKTRLSGVVAGLLLAAILLGLGKLVGHIPNAVLAGILVTVGIGIIDYKGIKHIKSVPLSDAVIMIIVLLLTVFVDLLVAVGVGMVLAAFVFMKKTADIVEGGSKAFSLKESSHDALKEEKEIQKNWGDKVFIKHIDGSLFFGMVSGFKEIIKSIPETAQIVIFNFENVNYVDQSGLYAVEEAVLDLKSKGVEVLFYKLKEQPRIMFEKIDIIPDLVKPEHCFDDMEKILEFLKNWFKY
jgi:SulP family sulfate permease